MTAFLPGVDTPATPVDSLMVEPPRVEDQVGSLKRPGPYFSNGFRAWCDYGLSTSGLAPDGKTWIAVPPEDPRPGGASSHAPSASTAAQRWRQADFRLLAKLGEPVAPHS
jgi:hypothetical protein